jgi:hypothetical protein
MNEKILLGSIADMKEYLANRCYCPGEIYSPDGFFFRIFSPDDECVQIASCPAFTAVICDDQIIMIWLAYEEHGGCGDEMIAVVIDTQRIDATDNNIKIIIDIATGNKPESKLDEFKPGSTKKALDDILSISNFIIRD